MRVLKISILPFVVITFLGIISKTSYAQNIGINITGATPSTNAILDLNTGNAKNVGLLIPRVVLGSSLTTFSPPMAGAATGLDSGMMVFNWQATNQPVGYYYWGGTATGWINVSATGNSWNITGNAGINSGTNFIGTINNQSLVFKVDNTKSGLIEPSINGNITMGYEAGENMYPYFNSVAIGAEALRSATNIGNMTGVGAYALYTNTSGLYNTAVGYEAIYSNITGSANVSIGNISGYNSRGSYNVFVGDSAGWNMTTGRTNTFVGYQTSGVLNDYFDATAIGYEAQVDGNNTVTLGDRNVTTFEFNGALEPSTVGGYSAGTTGQVLTSRGAGVSPQWSTVNLWLLTGNTGTNPATNWLGTNDGEALQFKVDGQKSGWIDYTSSYNTSFGFEAENSVTTGTLNTAIGVNALYSNSVQSGNIAIGDSALYTQSFGTAFNSGNVAIGNSALFANQPTSQYTGYQNTAIGEWAMRHNTSGNNNTATGYSSLYANTTGSSNTAIGWSALTANQNGNTNTALGTIALESNTSGSTNTSIGAFTLAYNQNGNTNTAIGCTTLYFNNSGSSNVAVGNNAGYNNTASRNVFLGDSAGANNTSGTYNTYIGYQADANGQYTNATAIGYNSSVTANNTIVLGNNNVTQTQFNGALMPYYSANYNAGIAGQVLASEGAGNSPQWVVESSSVINANNGAALSGTSVQLGDASNATFPTGNQFITNGRIVTQNGLPMTFDLDINTAATKTTGTFTIQNGTGLPYFYVSSAGTAANGVKLSIGNNAPGANIFNVSTTANTTTNGNAITMTAQQGDATGNGGAFNITAGAAGNTSGAGGAVNIAGGSSTGTTGGEGGAISISAGTSTTAVGNNVTLQAGAGNGGTNAGGNIYLEPGAAAGTGTNGGVGIGNAAITPQENLSVNNGLNIDQSSSDAGTLLATPNYALTFGSGSGEGIGSNRTSGTTLYALDFYTDFTERMTILGGGGNGYVGIANTAPATLLQVGNGGATGKLSVYSKDNNYGQFQIGNPTSNGEASMEFISGETAFGDAATSTNGTGYLWTVGAGSYGIGGNSFCIANVAYGGPVITFESGGNVGIGCTTPSQKLYVVGNIYATGTILGTQAACSDVRFKKEITPLSNALDNVLKLQGVNYYWKKDEFPDRHFNDKLQIGFIAQELEKTYPEMVFTDSLGFKYVDYSRLTPVLVEAIKQQQQMIADQKKMITQQQTTTNTQQSSIDELKNEIDALKKQMAALAGNSTQTATAQK